MSPVVKEGLEFVALVLTAIALGSYLGRRKADEDGEV
jgi:hypothetical protein